MTYNLEDEKFVIDDDKKAEWALRVIKDDESERDRLIDLAESQIVELKERIEELKAKCDNKTAFLKGHLAQYMSTVKTKETKTQETYELLSGKLVMKKASQKITHPDDAKLIAYLRENDGDDYIKIKESVDWAEFKKNLSIEDGNVVDTELGIIIPSDACAVEDVPASFDIKFKEE